MRERIIELIAQVKEDPSIAKQMVGSSHLVNEVGLDSLKVINLILLVEQEFSVEVDFDSFEIDHLSSLDKFVGYVEALPRL
jgi:acyl carrier protein